MKLSDHVDKIRNLITASFDKQFARLGIGANKQIELEKLPEQFRGKRQHLEVMLENHIGETGCYQDAREKLLDELSFTLFNRLAAVKVMESANLFPPVITKQAEHGGRSFGHKAWLEEYPKNRENELEGIRDYFKHAFNELGDSLSLYSKEYPYALLPDAISLNEIVEAFNVIAEDSQVEDDIWQSDDVLGWLYESYNNAKKQAFKDSKAKTEYDKVSLQSQVYTPRWVVQFLVENSLGKLYLEMYPESDIKNQFKIANAPKTQERDPKPLHEIKLIDPASGSGNFLLYAFDFFYELYVDQIENYDADYDEDEIPQLIIENNLHGIDLDDRAIQLAQLGLYIKARKKRRFIKGSFNFKVVSSDFYLPEYNEARHIFEESDNLDDTQKELIEDIWNDLRYAYKFGSLIRLDEKLKAKLNELESKQEDKVLDLFSDADIREQKDFTEKFFTNLKAAVEQFASKNADTFIASKTRDAITFLELLTTQYDVACANPPYTDSADFGSDLKVFIDSNYKKPSKFNTNLYASFIKRCYELTAKDGKVAMIHPHTFMFIKTFEDVRKFMIDKCHIDIMVDFGLDRVNLFGPGILLDATFYIISKGKNDQKGLYFNLTTNLQEKFKKSKFIDSLNDYMQGITNDRTYTLEQSKLKIIKSWPFIYWISDEFREKFEHSSFDEAAMVVSGVKTGDNDRLLRYWWEVDQSDISQSYPKDNKPWIPYSKGGDFNKWFGNIWLCVNYKNDGQEIKKSKNYNLLLPSKSFRKGITYSATSTKGVSFRLLEEHCLFDMKGSSIMFDDSNKTEYALAVLNSKMSSYIANCLNGTVETQVGDIKRIPYSEQDTKQIESLAITCIEIKKYLQRYSLVESLFEISPIEFFSDSKDIKKRALSYLNYENKLLTQVLVNEAIINEKVFEVYELTDNDKEMILTKEGVSIGSLPVLPEARSAYLTELEGTEQYSLETIVPFIKELPSKEITINELEFIESELPMLYKNNNDLEAFCIRHQMNPINIWYWMKKSIIVQKHRFSDLVMELLADIVREVLRDDDDGIIPLVTNAGEKILFDRVEEKFLEKGFSSAQYHSLESVLGRPINDYLSKNFFSELSDHLNMFPNLPKTPFIWHLTSGSYQGFDCYISIYKWSRDNLMRIRSIYIEHRERALVNRQSDLVNNESVGAQNEKDKIIKQLKEIEALKIKIDELLEEGYNPTIDDGVAKNISPLQKKKMLAYDVLNAGQLKKYLNADW
jgi:hypothetical protein